MHARLFVTLGLLLVLVPLARAQPFNYNGAANTQQFANTANWEAGNAPPTFGSTTTSISFISVQANSNRPLVNNGTTPFVLSSATFADTLGLATTLRGSPLTFHGPDALVRVNTAAVPAAVLNTITSDTAVRFLLVPGSQLGLRQLQGLGEFTFEGGTTTIDAAATFQSAVLRNGTVVAAANNALPPTSGPRLFGASYTIGESFTQTFSGPAVTLSATQQGSQVSVGAGGQLTLGMSELVVGTGDYASSVTGAGAVVATQSVLQIRGQNGANVGLVLSPGSFSAPAVRVRQTKMLFDPASAVIPGPLSLEQAAVFFIGRPDVYNFAGGIGVDADSYLSFQNPLVSNSFSNSIRAAGIVGGGRVLVYGGTFTLNPTTTHNFSGVMTTWAEGGLVIDGAGTQKLSGVNQLAGLTRVLGGTLEVTGSTGTGATAVAGGRLSGTGTLGPVSMSSGTVSPGTPTGTLTVGSLSLTGGRVEISVSGPATSGRIRSVGAVALGAGAVLDLPNPGGAFAAGDRIVLIENAGADPTTGQFAGLSEGAEAAQFSNLRWLISYSQDVTGDGVLNDVVLVAAPVPEPAGILFASAAAVLGYWRSRTRKAIHP